MAKKASDFHIFDAPTLTPMAIRWKELTDKGRHKEAMVVLEELIHGCTQMFQRLAQHENFHYTVDLSILTAAAQEKMVKWLMAWNPKKGSLFSWLSTCAKNAFRSEVNKIVQYRRRYHVTSDNLELFYGTEDHEAYAKDAAEEMRKDIEDITIRWGDPQEIGCLKYLLACVTEDDTHDRIKAIRSACYAWGLPIESGKFFYNWILIALREKLYQKVHIKFTEQDIFRAEFSYTPLIDLLNIVTWDQMKKIIAILGGTRLKVPTVPQMARLAEDHKLFEEIDKSDKDPDSVEKIAKNNKRSARSAQEVYEEQLRIIHPNRSTELSLNES